LPVDLALAEQGLESMFIDGPGDNLVIFNIDEKNPYILDRPRIFTNFSLIHFHEGSGSFMLDKHY